MASLGTEGKPVTQPPPAQLHGTGQAQGACRPHSYGGSSEFGVLVRLQPQPEFIMELRPYKFCSLICNSEMRTEMISGYYEDSVR